MAKLHPAHCIRNTSYLDDAEGIVRLTLEDLLADATLSKLFESSFCVVAASATVEEARSAMKRIPNCRDIFVTAGGSAKEPVIGWLTDVDLEAGRRANAQTP